MRPMHRIFGFRRARRAATGIRAAAAALLALCILAPAPLPAQHATPRFKRAVVERRMAAQQAAEDRQPGAARPTTAALASVGVRFQQWRQSNDVLARRLELRAARGISVAQILAYDRLKGASPDLAVVWDETRTVPIDISGSCLQRPRAMVTGAGEPERTARDFLDNYRELLGLASPAEELRTASVTTDELGRTHVRFRQAAAGVEFWGREWIVHLRADGIVDHAAGRIVATADRPFAASFRLTAPEAAGIAERAVAAVTPLREFGAGERALLGYEGPAALPRLYAERANSAPRPCYVVELRPNLRDRWRVFVDAADGRVIAQYNATCGDGPQKADATDLHGQTRTIDTYLASGRSWMIDASRAMFKASQSTFPDKTVGTIITLDARNTDLQTAYYLSSATNTWTDRSSVSAHYTTGIVYEYFRATHGRNSIDGNGMSMISVVNVTESGQSMVNAYWNGKLVAYGNGGGGFSPLAGAVDVVTHELTHGVTEYTANLEYVSQSGALNESFSDIFGAMVDRDDWTIGEQVTPTSGSFPRGTLRDMADPHNGLSTGADAWQPAHMNEYVTLPTSQDNGGVHINSGIPNRAAYLLSTAVGRDKAERILYRALTVKLTSQAQFIDFRLAIVHSAEDLYGAGSAEVNACRSACDQVGILDGSGTGKEGDDPAVNGADRMLALSTDPNDPYYLWIITPPATGANDFQSLTATPVDRRPSVSDDGSIAVFIDRAKNIRAIALNPAAPNEQVLQGSGVWGSIAISRDKNLIAVTTDAADRAIHVYDLATSPATLHSFTIYTPSYSGDPVPNAAQFADAMDFSHDNSTLLYDCYNLVTSDFGDIGYWEINMMDVWDPSARAFAAGRVHRVFPQEPDVSIGNPVFARNKKTVFAFDLEDLIDGAWYVMATDFFDNATRLVTQTTSTGDPGYPSYRGDDRMLSYAEPDLGGVMQVMNVDLAADAITATGQPAAYIYSATMPIWFRTGSRPVAAEPVPGAPDDAGIALDPNYPNPAARRTTIRYRLDAAQTVRLAVSDLLGREVALLDAGFRDAGEHTAAWDTRDTRGRPVPAGPYFLRLTTATGARTRIVRVAR